MQVSNQSNIQPQSNIAGATNPINNQTQQVQTPVQVQQPTVQQYPQGYLPPQNMYYPQYPQPQATPPTASAVNIQIMNPTVGGAGGVGAGSYAQNGCNCGIPCYPSGYYTGTVGADGRLYPNYNPNAQAQAGTTNAPTPQAGGGSNVNNGEQNGNVNNGTNNGTIGNNNNNTTTTNNTTTNNNNTTTNGENKAENGDKVNSANNDGDKKKTEKRKIVELTDDYIRNLESYLNSQEKEVRLNAAKEVYARLAEDESRHDDKALTALINKMLQDPSEEIRLIALSALEGRIVTGDDYTVGVLQKMQQKSDGYGQDAVDASNILLKMSGKQVEKEFEVKDNQKKESSNKEGQKQESKKA